jgi:hypothetical protein
MKAAMRAGRKQQIYTQSSESSKAAKPLDFHPDISTSIFPALSATFIDLVHRTGGRNGASKHFLNGV